MKTDCMELLFEASKYHMLPNKQPLLDSQRTRVRGAGPCLLALGGKGKKWLKKLRIRPRTDKTHYGPKRPLTGKK